MCFCTNYKTVCPQIWKVCKVYFVINTQEFVNNANNFFVHLWCISNIKFITKNAELKLNSTSSIYLNKNYFIFLYYNNIIKINNCKIDFVYIIFAFSFGCDIYLPCQDYPRRNYIFYYKKVLVQLNVENFRNVNFKVNQIYYSSFTNR